MEDSVGARLSWYLSKQVRSTLRRHKEDNMHPDGYSGIDHAATRLRFERKLKIFGADYELKERPALVVQACPVDVFVELDLADSALRVALAQGSADATNSSWTGLQGAASGLRGSVDGIACVSGYVPPIWASELHTDAHLIAGVWDFDRPTGSGKDALITWEYVDLFADFGRLVASVATKIDRNTADWLVTATLLRADCLQYGSKANRRTNSLSPPLRRPHLEFRVRPCAGVDGLQRAVGLMAKDFQRAYGEPA
jgi:hypothetical protein